MDHVLLKLTEHSYLFCMLLIPNNPCWNLLESCFSCYNVFVDIYNPALFGYKKLHGHPRDGLCKASPKHSKSTLMVTMQLIIDKECWICYPPFNKLTLKFRY